MSAREVLAVVGGGYMGGGIAQALALAGHPVRLVDADAAASDAAVARVRAELAAAAGQGLVDPDAAAAAAELVSASPTIDHAVDGVGYVTEAVPEILELKHEVLARIAAVAPDAVIGSNTSSLPIRELARGNPHPGRLLGVHWFNPAPHVPLVEIAAGDDDVAERVAQLLRAAGKTPLRVPDVAGFLGNRLQFALYREAALIVEEGLADAETVDAAVTASFGMRLPFLGPLLVGDIAGLDVYLAAFRSLEGEYGERFAPPTSLVERVAEGDLGIKSGGGLRGIPAERRDELARHRDRVLAAVGRLQRELARETGSPEG